MRQDDFKICDRLATRVGAKPVVAKFIRGEFKSVIMGSKAFLKGRKLKSVINDDFTPLRSKLSEVLRTGKTSSW